MSYLVTVDGEAEAAYIDKLAILCIRCLYDTFLFRSRLGLVYHRDWSIS